MTSRDTTLIVLRGPSGSGKSTVAKAIRATRQHPTALIEQDYFRRTILKEKDVVGALNIELIKRTTLFALENGYDVILEGIFYASHYEDMFRGILQAHPANIHFFYFDISFDETLRRHQSKPNKNDFGEPEMRRWYREKDHLAHISETIIHESNSVDASLAIINRTEVSQ